MQCETVRWYRARSFWAVARLGPLPCDACRLDDGVGIHRSRDPFATHLLHLNAYARQSVHWAMCAWLSYAKIESGMHMATFHIPASTTSRIRRLPARLHSM